LECLKEDLAELTNSSDAAYFVMACEELNKIKYRLINA